MRADLVVSVSASLQWGLSLGPMFPFLPSITSDLESLSITLDSTGIGSFSLEIDAWDTKAQDFAYLTDGRIAVSNRLQIGLSNDNGSADLIYGPITAHSASVSQGGCSLSVSGYDVRHKLRQGRFVRTFTGKNPLEIAEAIIGERGLKVKVTRALGAPPAAFPVRRQTKGSDYEFIMGLLKDTGYRMDCELDTIHIRQPTAKPFNPFDITSFKPTTMLSFSGSQSAVELIDGVIVMAFDRETQTQVIGTAGETTSFLGTPTVITKHAQVDTAAQADAIAANELASRNRTANTGSLRCVGDINLVPGGWVDVADVGPYSGAYRITRAVHAWNAGAGYTTDLTLEQDGS